MDALVGILRHWALGNGSPFIVLSGLTQRAISIAVLMLAFTVLLKFLPTTRMLWRDAALGAAAAALLFEGGKRLFSFYLARAGTANMFGVAGSLAIILMWLLLGGRLPARRGAFSDGRPQAHAPRIRLALRTVRKKSRPRTDGLSATLLSLGASLDRVVAEPLGSVKSCAWPEPRHA